MKSVYKFVAGNSRTTPAGLAIAAVVAFALRDRLGWWSAVVYIAVLIVTLAVSTFERIQ
ncbi:MAG TPA: hypothetical protein VIG51_04450 [Candidatus Baltobacteraceae bacterium]|jgi:hypothetical protein